MPYVLQERRPALDKVVDELAKIDLKPGSIKRFLICLIYRGAPIQSNYMFPGIKKAMEEACKADIKPNGDINYILFKYCKYHLTPSYNNYKEFMGELYDAMNYSVSYYKNELRESAEWIRIKILTPYEEEAIKKNGDI